MRQLVRYGIFIGLMCIGLLSGGLLGKSYGQVCPVNQGCRNTLGADAHYGTISGGTGYNVTGYGGTVGVQLSPGSNAWSIVSDRALKEDFQPIDKQQILAGVQRLSIQNWKLKDEKGNVRHIGPVAQDFHTTFGLGSDERYLHSGDVDGIALAAIQALADQVQALREQNQALATRLAAMEQK